MVSVHRQARRPDTVAVAADPFDAGGIGPVRYGVRAVELECPILTGVLCDVPSLEMSRRRPLLLA